MRRLKPVMYAGLLTLLTSCSGSVTVEGSNPLEGWNWGKIALGVFLLFGLFGSVQHVYEGKVRRATRKLGALDDQALLLDIALSDESNSSSYKAVSGLDTEDAARLAVERLASLGATKPLELVAEHSRFEHVRELAAKKLLLLGFNTRESGEGTEPTPLPYLHVDPWWKLGTGVSILAICFGVIMLTLLLTFLFVELGTMMRG